VQNRVSDWRLLAQIPASASLPEVVACSSHATHYDAGRETATYAGGCHEICDNDSLSASCFGMDPQASGEAVSRKRKRVAAEVGPFVLRSLLEDLPLSADGDRDDVEINCVEFLGMSMVYRLPPCQQWNTS